MFQDDGKEGRRLHISPLLAVSEHNILSFTQHSKPSSNATNPSNETPRALPPAYL
jgi:hypothetical protein